MKAVRLVEYKQRENSKPHTMHMCGFLFSPQLPVPFSPDRELQGAKSVPGKTKGAAAQQISINSSPDLSPLTGGSRQPRWCQLHYAQHAPTQLCRWTHRTAFPLQQVQTEYHPNPGVTNTYSAEKKYMSLPVFLFIFLLISHT